MIQITPQMRIMVAVEPLDFRNGIDGLGRVCREVLKSDPFPVLFSCSATRGPQRSRCWSMMARASGCVRSGSPGGALGGGQRILMEL
jgi:hypothetical protein